MQNPGDPLTSTSAATFPWRRSTDHACDLPKCGVVAPPRTKCGDVVLASLAVMANTKKVREVNALDLDKFVSYRSTDSTPTTASTGQVVGLLYSIHHGFEDTRLGIGPTVVAVTDIDATLDFV